jgi:hypothetical protein
MGALDESADRDLPVRRIDGYAFAEPQATVA